MKFYQTYVKYCLLVQERKEAFSQAKVHIYVNVCSIYHLQNTANLHSPMQQVFMMSLPAFEFSIFCM